jgi:hypothetical protein
VLATGVAATTTGDGATREADFWVGSLLAVGTFVSMDELRSGDSFGVCACASGGVSVCGVVSERASQGRAREEAPVAAKVALTRQKQGAERVGAGAGEVARVRCSG